MSKLAEYLNRHTIGNVFDRPSICEAYSTDRSILKITPRLVAIPESTDDIRKLLRFADQLANRDFFLPITPRGTGLDKTGASIGEGLLISMEKFNHIEEIDVRGRLVRVQPGMTLGKLNEALRLQGMWLPVEYDSRVTLGGLIANCPSDDAARRYGGIYQFVERVEVVLANGDLVQLSPMSLRAAEAKANEDSTEGVLYRKISKILDKFDDVILDRSMRPFDAMGYANIVKVREQHSVNLLPLMFASQGTLGIISDIVLHVEPVPPESRRLLVSFHDLKAAGIVVRTATSSISLLTSFSGTFFSTSSTGTLPLRKPCTFRLVAKRAKAFSRADCKSFASSVTLTSTLVSDNFFVVVFIWYILP